jgi:catechol 2,3-dioxygenase-like lactoylglutathione lyase family enzyme
MISHVKFVSIPSRNQDEALKFWTEKIGMRVVTDQPFSPTQRWIELRVGHAETRFVLFTMDGDQERIGKQFNGAFACDNVQKTFEELKANGVLFKAEPKQEPWGTFAIFSDPDGNEFVLGSK